MDIALLSVDLLCQLLDIAGAQVIMLDSKTSVYEVVYFCVHIPSMIDLSVRVL